MKLDEQQQILCALVLIYLLHEVTREDDAPAAETDFEQGVRRTRARLDRASDVLQRGGAAVYDALHDDKGHKQDLPGQQLSKAAVLAIATQAGFPNPKLAAAIAMAESGGVPNAVAHSSREFSVGLWQINIYAHPLYSWWDMQDPRKNAAAAYKISKGGTDWRPWSAFTNGAYKLFMTGIYR